MTEQASTSFLPWLEKYRPRTFTDVVGNEETILRFQAIVNQGHLPNIILTVRLYFIIAISSNYL